MEGVVGRGEHSKPRGVRDLHNIPSQCYGHFGGRNADPGRSRSTSRFFPLVDKKGSFTCSALESPPHIRIPHLPPSEIKLTWYIDRAGLEMKGLAEDDLCIGLTSGPPAAGGQHRIPKYPAAPLSKGPTRISPVVPIGGRPHRRMHSFHLPHNKHS